MSNLLSMTDSMPLHAGVATIHVVDDEPSICRLFERICAQMGLRVQTYSGAEAFLENYDPETPGCLILDVQLPQMSGLELLERISELQWRIPIVIISGKAEVSTAVRAFKLGTIDFLEKPFTKDEIAAVVTNAVQIDLQQRRENAQLSEIARRVNKLTPRERQVMDLVVEGKSNRVIADELGVSPKTIEVHRANVMQKMEAGSLAGLVRMVIANRQGSAEPVRPPESTDS